MAFVKFRGLTWPDEAAQLLRVSVLDVQTFRGQLVAHNAAPKTLNRRISSLSSLYKYLAGTAAEVRLPIIVPNPAHAQFIFREATDPWEETRALSARPRPPTRRTAGWQFRARLPRSRDSEVLSVLGRQAVHRLPPEGVRLPPRRRFGDDPAPREG